MNNSTAALRLVCTALIGSIILILAVVSHRDNSCAWLTSPATGRSAPPSYECGNIR